LSIAIHRFVLKHRLSIVHIGSFHRLEAEVPSWIDPKLIQSELVSRLHSWWASNCGQSGIPDRQDFDPIRHKDLLPSLMISEAVHDPFRIRYRLVGTRVVAVTGFDFTGRFLDELLGENASEPWMEHYASIYRMRVPLFGRVTEATISGSTFSYDFGIVPVRHGGDEVKQFISVEDYFGFQLISAGLRPWPQQS